MRAQFLLNRKQSWFRQFLRLLGQKAVSLLTKLYRCIPNLRPRPYLPYWRENICPTDDVAVKKDDSVSQEIEPLVQDLIYTGMAGLTLLGDGDENKWLPTQNRTEEPHFDGVDFYDVQTLNKQGNFELALMAGGQEEVDTDEDENFAGYEDWECVRYEEWEEDRWLHPMQRISEI
ncbi:hypothetical protein KR074_000660 [Drosophila pseudoananassae]|nr:hypothetical protein KR074_000660 [Drosophila pseudoananassae]